MSPVTTRLPDSARALRHRNFRLFLGGQIVSLVGTWMQQVALGWLVYRLTRSAFLLGLVGFAGQIPSLVLAPLAGVWVDRLNRHRIVIATQALSMVQALLLAALVLGDAIGIGGVIALSLFLGIVNAIDVPARQSFLVQMVGREDLANAIALNSSTFNAARLVGPFVAGVLIARIGEGRVFLLNGVSYVAVIAALLAMRVAPQAAAPGPARDAWRNLRDGARYVSGSPAIRILLLLLALVNFVGVPFSVLMPVFATEVLGGDAHTLGLLMGAIGVGALVGAFTLATRATVRGLSRLVGVGAGVFGAALALFAFSRSVALSLLLLLLCGYGMMLQAAGTNTILQTIVDDDKRGRVMSFYTAAMMGTMPVGSLMAGVVAARVGAPNAVLLGGLACLAGTALYLRARPALRLHVRPIYVRLGIIPDAAPGLAPPAEGNPPE